MIKKFLFLILIFAVLSGVAAAQEKNADGAEEETVLANVMARDVSPTEIILVDKSRKNLVRLKAAGDNAAVENSYEIIYGVNEGDKLLSGDGKTPEGIYYTDPFRSGESLVKRYGNYAKIYGFGSFPLNYPNPVDRIRKKTGHGIWLHGRDPINGKSYTQGCVALHDEDLRSLKETMPVRTPVIISQSLSYINKKDYSEKREKLYAMFDAFIKSWREGDYETFEGFVHPDFRGAGKNASRYLASKKYLMGAYKNRVIENRGTLALIQNDKNVVFDTDQFYCARNITSYGNKKFYFVEHEGALKLISEEYLPMDPSGIITEEINEFLKKWVSAWESGEADEYIEYYSKNFKTGKMNYEKWYEYKKAIFDKTTSINLEIKDVRWTANGNVYKATFLQKYSAGESGDVGIKTLTFEGCPGEFKIISETWKAN